MINYGKMGIEQTTKKLELDNSVKLYNVYIIKKHQDKKIKRPITKKQIHKLQKEVNCLRKILGLTRINVKHSLLRDRPREWPPKPTRSSFREIKRGF